MQLCEYHKYFPQLAVPFCLQYLLKIQGIQNKFHSMFSSVLKIGKVNRLDEVFILTVLAITGLTTAFLLQAVTPWVGFGHKTHWLAKLLQRLVLLSFECQVMLLFVAFLLGQFSFFWKFKKKLLQQIGLTKYQKESSSSNI